MRKLVNLTPHPVTFFTPQGKVEMAGSASPARLKETLVTVGEVNGIEVFTVTYGEPENLPEPKAGRLLIVPTIIRQALPHRFDLVSPCQFVRDEQGQITGAKGLCGSHWTARWIAP